MARRQHSIAKSLIISVAILTIVGLCGPAKADVCFETILTPDHVPLFLAPADPSGTAERPEQHFTVENLPAGGMTSPVWIYDVEVHPFNVALKFNQWISVSTAFGEPSLTLASSFSLAVPDGQNAPRIAPPPTVANPPTPPHVRVCTSRWD